MAMGGAAMSLQALSGAYQEAARLLQSRLQLLRAQLKQETNPDRLCRLKRQRQVYNEAYRQCRELQELTERYYERSYYRSGKYTL